MGRKTALRHKETNTFRFQTYSEQLRAINTRIIADYGNELRSGRLDDDTEEESNLSQTITEWTQKNSTASFDRLILQIGVDVKSIAQVLHDKNRLVRVISEHITSEEVYSFDATTQIVLALCKDLGKEFHSSLAIFIEAISKVVMENGTAPVIETGFKTMAYLFKYCRTHVMQNFSRYCELMVPLLTADKSYHLKAFAAQSLELVCQTVWKTSRVKLFAWIAENFIIKHPKVVEGISLLLFSMMKGFKGKLKLTAMAEFKDCLNLLKTITGDSRDKWTSVVEATMELLLSELDSAEFSALYAQAQEQLIEAVSSKGTHFVNFLSIVRTLTIKSNPESRKTVETISRVDCFSCEQFKEFSSQAMLAEIVEFILKENVKICLEFQYYILKFIGFPELDSRVLSTLDNSLMKNPAYAEIYLLPISAASGNHFLIHFGKYYLIKAQSQFKEDKEDSPYSEFNELSLPMYFPNFYNIQRRRLAASYKYPEMCCDVTKELQTAIGNDFDDELVSKAISYSLFISRTVEARKGAHCINCFVSCKVLVSCVMEQYVRTNCTASRRMNLLKILCALVEAYTYLKFDPSHESLFLVTQFCANILETDVDDQARSWVLKALDCIIGHFANCKPEEPVYSCLRDRGYHAILMPYLRSNFKHFRVFALSILINLTTTEDLAVGFRHSMISMLEIESKNTVDPEYGSFVALRLERIKRILMTDCTDLFLEVVLSYTFGLLYVDYVENWPKCHTLIEQCWDYNKILTAKVLRQKFETILSAPSAQEVPELDVTESTARSLEEEYEMAVFGFPFHERTHSARLATAVSADNFLCRIWPSLTGFDEVPKQSKLDLSFLWNQALETLSKMRQPIPYYGVRRDNPHCLRSLQPILNFISKCHNLRSRMTKEEGLHSLIDLVSDMLITKHSNLKTTAMKTLIELQKQLEPYKEHLLEACAIDYNPHGFLEEAVEPIIKKPKDREIVMKVVVKVLSEAFRKLNDQGKSTLLKSVAGFREEEAKLFIDWTVGKWDQWKDVTVELSNLHSRMSIISVILKNWLYRFPKLISYLLKMICEMTRVAKRQEVHDAIDAKKMKDIQLAGLSCLYTTFQTFSKLEFTADEIESIFQIFVEPMIPNLANMSTGGESVFLRLLGLWGKVERYRVLLTKYVSTSEGTTTLMDEMFKLLIDPKVHNSVKVSVTSHFLSWVPDDDEEEIDDSEILPGLVSESTPLPVGNCFQFSGSEDLPLGLKILLHGRRTLLTFTSDKALKSVCLNTPQSLQNYFKLLEYILPHVSENTAAEVCLGMTHSFRPKPSEEKAVLNYFRTMKIIAQRTTFPFMASMSLAKYFAIIKDRTNRTALCQLFAVLKPECASIISSLNAWSATDVDGYDFAERHMGVKQATRYLAENSFCELTYAILAYNFFYTMKNETQSVLCREALDALSKMAQSLAPPTDIVELQVRVNKFLDEVILNEIQKGLRTKDVKVFQNYLEVLSTFIRYTSHKHGTLRDLRFLVNYVDGILEGMCDIQVNEKTKAMNRLSGELDSMLRQKPFNPLGAKVLISYIMPIALFYMDTEKEGKGSGVSLDNVLDNLIASSINAVKAVMRLLSPKAYVDYLNNLLSNPPRNPKLHKRYKRHLIAVMDGFHYSFRTFEEMAEEYEKENSKNSLANEDRIPLVPLREIPDDSKESYIRLLHPVLEKLQEFLKYKESINYTKSGKQRTEDNADTVLQVECTLGLVKLLRKLPPKKADDLMRPIIPSLCASMKTPDHAKRRTTKATLIHLLKELGPHAFKQMLHLLQANLKVGFQLHVLNQVISSLLTSCEPNFYNSPDSIPIKSLIPLCENELYGIMAEEKKVGKIVEKTYEARSNNTEHILRICARYATSFDDLALLVDAPLKQFEMGRSEIRQTQTKKWLTYVNSGLVQNEILEDNDVLNWLHARLSTQQSDRQTKKIEPEKNKRKSTYDLNQGPSKGVKEGENVTDILFQQFVLQCLRSFVHLRRSASIEVVEKFKYFLVDGMQSVSQQVVLLSLQCAKLLLQLKCYSFAEDEDKLLEMWRSLVLTLSKFCFTQADNYPQEMINSIFSAITTFLETFTKFKLLQDDLVVLLKCIENFVTSGNCSSSALALLQGVLTMRVQCVELESLMASILKSSVRAHAEHVIQGCRKAYISYLLIYKTKTEQLTEFILLLVDESAKASRGHEATSILDTINKLVEDAPLGIFNASAQTLLWKVFLSVTKNIAKEAALSLFRRLVSRKDFVEPNFDFMDILFEAEFEGPPEARIFAYVEVVVALEERCPPNSKHRARYLSLRDRVGEYYLSLLVAPKTPVKPDQSIPENSDRSVVVAVSSVVKHYVKKNGHWEKNGGFVEGNGTSTLPWKKLIDLILETRLSSQDPLVKFLSMEIFQNIFNNVDWSVLVTKMRSGKIHQYRHGPRFLLKISKLQRVLGDLLSVLEYSRWEENTAMALETLLIFLQLVVRLSEVKFEGEPGDEDGVDDAKLLLLQASFVGKLIGIIHREVIKDATSFKMRAAAYQLLQGYIGMLDNQTEMPIDTDDLTSHTKRISAAYYEKDTNLLTRIEGIVAVAVRDSTDRNLEAPFTGSVKRDSETLLGMIKKRIEATRFDPMYALAMKKLDTRRKENRTKKAQVAVLYPGLKRKRTAPKMNPQAEYTQASKGNKKRKT